EQYDRGGELRFAVFYGAAPVQSNPVETGPESTRFSLFGGNAGGLTAAGTLTVLDQQNRDILKVTWKEQEELWQLLVEMDLPPGVYTFRFDVPGHFVLNRDDQVLPPAPH